MIVGPNKRDEFPVLLTEGNAFSAGDLLGDVGRPVIEVPEETKFVEGSFY